MNPVGYWNTTPGERPCLGLYLLRKPSLFRRLLVWLVMGWVWVDEADEEETP